MRRATFFTRLIKDLRFFILSPEIGADLRYQALLYPAVDDGLHNRRLTVGDAGHKGVRTQRGQAPVCRFSLLLILHLEYLFPLLSRRGQGGSDPPQNKCYSRGYAIARCQAKTTLKSYWHELRDHQEYCKKIAMKTGTHTQVPVPMTNMTNSNTWPA